MVNMQSKNEIVLTDINNYSLCTKTPKLIKHEPVYKDIVLKKNVERV